MSKPKPPFRSIAAPLDVDDAALEAVNRRLGVPTLRAAAPEPGEPKPLKAKSKPAPEKPEVPPRAALEKLTMEVPAYLLDAIKRRALDERMTVRHVVMLALKGQGFEIDPGDLVPDARRTRHKR